MVRTSRAPCLTLLSNLAVAVVLFVSRGQAQERVPELQTSFPVRYVTEGAVYLGAGSSAGLAPGQQLEIRREGSKESDAAGKVVAQLTVVSVASASAVCEVRSSTRPIVPGDVAYLSPNDAAKLQQLRETRESRKYPQVVSFTEGDPTEEEVRAQVPHPPSPEVNRIRGRIGFDYGGLCDLSDGGANTQQLGLMLRADMTRIGGSFWNFGGYYRGRINSRSTPAAQQTLSEIINRTYQLALTYNNPNSRWVAGAGRFYLPWASSMNTIDGGYLGRRFGKVTTLGIFGGSSPDPTSWNYDPNRQMAGAFVNFEGGSFDSLRYSSTLGAALTRVNWNPDRQFGFFENGLFLKNYLSIYHNLEADLVRGTSENPGSGAEVSRSYLTVRVQPSSTLSFDVSHNYFRNVPTFDMRLVSTGLVDRLLFQGVSGGVRIGLPYHLTAYASLGRSDRTGDEQSSWNQMYGLTAARIWRTGIRGDFRYSKFFSSFGEGTYSSLSLTREIGEGLRVDLQAGQQDIVSPLTSQTRARWITSNLDWFIWVHYFLGGGLTLYRGNAQSYDQWYVNLGYRF